MQHSNHVLEINNAELSYEFSSDAFYLQQYAELVKQYYKKDLNLDLDANHMAADLACLQPHERLFIVRAGQRVIGGAKLSFSSRDAQALLPMEHERFRVAALLPADYGDHAYAEIGRLVVNPDFRGKEVLARLIQELSTYSRAQGAGQLFVLAPPLNAVLYRRVCRGLSMQVEFHKDVDWGEKEAYRHLQLQLISCDIRQHHAGEWGQELSIAV